MRRPFISLAQLRCDCSESVSARDKLGSNCPLTFCANCVAPSQTETHTSASRSTHSYNVTSLRISPYQGDGQQARRVTMAEAIGLASAFITIVATVYISCRDLQSIIDEVANAPKHIQNLSSDLRDFYCVLGSLQSLLDGQESSKNFQEQAISANLQNVLKNCLLIFEDVGAIISQYQANNRQSTGTWQRLKWHYKEPEIRGFQRDLLGCKTALNLAISMANL